MLVSTKILFNNLLSKIIFIKNHGVPVCPRLYLAVPPSIHSRPFAEFGNLLSKILLKTWCYLKKQPFIVLKLFDNFWFLPFLRHFSSKLCFEPWESRLERIHRICSCKTLPIGWNLIAGPGLRSGAETFPATSAADLFRSGKGKRSCLEKVRCENVLNFYKTDPFCLRTVW